MKTKVCTNKVVELTKSVLLTSSLSRRASGGSGSSGLAFWVHIVGAIEILSVICIDTVTTERGEEGVGKSGSLSILDPMSIYDDVIWLRHASLARRIR